MKNNAPSNLLLILFLLPSVFVFTTETPALNGDPDTYCIPDRYFAFYLPRTVEKHSWLVTIDHRAAEPAFKNPLEDGFGLDGGGFKIGLGARYGLADHLDAGFRRVNNVWEIYDTYEWDLRYQIQHERNINVDLSLYGGFTWYYIPKTQDASGFSGGVLLGKTLSKNIYLSTGVLSNTNSTYKTKPDSAEVFSVALPVGMNVVLKKGLSLVAEGALPFSGYSAGYPSWGLGLKFETYNHNFSIFLSNTQYFTTDGFVCGSDTLTQPVLGFVIARQFGKGR